MPVSDHLPSTKRAGPACRVACAALFIVSITAPAFSQTPWPPRYRTGPRPPIAEEVNLSGPRVGLTFLSDGVVRALKDRTIDVSSPISQFGWQFEKKFVSQEGGITAVSEWVVLVGGLEQSLVLPSVSWLAGLRMKNGAEFAIGPNLTPAGAALAIAAGVTFRRGALNFPVNVAVVPSKSGLRVSVLTGFNRR